MRTARLDERLDDRVALALVAVHLDEQRRREEGLHVVDVDLGRLARELLDPDRDAVGLGAVLDREVPDAVLDEVAEEEGEDLVVVLGDAQVLAVGEMRVSSRSLKVRREGARARKSTDRKPRCSCFLMLDFCADTKLPTMTWIARSMSSLRTYSRRCILALASAMRIIDSRWRTVIGYEPVESDSRRSSEYRREIFSWSIICSAGLTRSRAYWMYLRRRSCGMSCARRRESGVSGHVTASGLQKTSERE